MAQRPFFIKIYALVAATIPVLIGSALLGIIATKQYLGDDTRRWVIDNRAATQILVQLASMALGALQIYALSSLIRFWTSTWLTSKPLKLDMLKFLEAVATCRLDTDLPVGFFVILITYLAIVQVPGALWAGALTPVSTNKITTAEMIIPEYSERFREDCWGHMCWPDFDCGSCVPGNTTSMGVFTYSAWKQRTALLITSIRQASSSNDTIPQYDKLDNSRYVYQGRSYGVGAAIGLVEDPKPSSEDESRPLLSYSYQEVGYRSHVVCGYNSSTNLSLVDLGAISVPNGYWSPGSFFVAGSLPVGPIYGYPLWGTGNAFGLVAAENGSHFQYGVTGDYYLSFLNNTQCDVRFTSTLFTVDVDLGRRLITVHPEKESSEPMDHVSMDKSVALIAFMGPQFIAMTVTSIYTATFADAFASNIENVRRRSGHVNTTFSDRTTGFSEGLQVLLDNILGSTGAAQAVFGDTKTVQADVTLQVMQIGEAIYTYGAFITSIIVFLLAIIDALRTLFWRHLPLFNPLDLKSAVLGVACSTDQLGSMSKGWQGDAADRDLGAVRILSSSTEPRLSFLGPTSRSRHSRSASTYVPLLRIGEEHNDAQTPSAMSDVFLVPSR